MRGFLLAIAASFVLFACSTDVSPDPSGPKNVISVVDEPETFYSWVGRVVNAAKFHDHFPPEGRMVVAVNEVWNDDVPEEYRLQLPTYLGCNLKEVLYDRNGVEFMVLPAWYFGDELKASGYTGPWIFSQGFVHFAECWHYFPINLS